MGFLRLILTNYLPEGVASIQINQNCLLVIDGSLCWRMSDSYLNAPVEDVTTLIIFIVGVFFIGLFIDWLRRKMGNYPMLP